MVSLFMFSCKTAKVNTQQSSIIIDKTSEKHIITPEIKVGAYSYENYLHELRDKKVGIVTNQSGIVTILGVNDTIANEKGEIIGVQHSETETISIVDLLYNRTIDLQTIFAPEHGFRGTADAGEHVIDGKDAKTDLPIISLYSDVME